MNDEPWRDLLGARGSASFMKRRLSALRRDNAYHSRADAHDLLPAARELLKASAAAPLCISCVALAFARGHSGTNCRSSISVSGSRMSRVNAGNASGSAIGEIGTFHSAARARGENPRPNPPAPTASDGKTPPHQGAASSTSMMAAATDAAVSRPRIRTAVAGLSLLPAAPR
jgi:hypothetical protein